MMGENRTLIDVCIQIEGPFIFSIEVTETDDTSTLYMLKLDGGEWRLDGLWVAQGRINRFKVLARALRMLEQRERK